MATQFEIDCALMAGRSYISTRLDINKFPIPADWAAIPNSYFSNPGSGFEAISFSNGTEIVISYAGTGSAVDWLANGGLVTGTGASQLLQAAEYYMQVKMTNPDATITFTGHSLGGGMASLLGVFFNEKAITFDQAPFRNATGLLVATQLRTYLAGQFPADIYPQVTTWLDPLNKFIFSFDPLGLGWSQDGLVARENANVTSINVQGEFLSALSVLRIGTPTTLAHGTPDLLLTEELHSQSLLAAFLANTDFKDVTFKLPDLVRLIFNDDLYKFDTKLEKENFIDRLVRYEFGNAPGATDTDMLTRFTNDLKKIAQDGGLSLSDQNGEATKFVSKALIAFAMQKYYDEKGTSAGYKKQLFNDVTGGVQFDMADVSVGAGDALVAGDKINFTEVKGFDQYFSKYLLQGSVFNAEERQLIQSLLPYLRDWYVQAGESAMNVIDAKDRGAFMLGGSASDILTGGVAADLLIGNAGNDTLKGGAGNDTLLGGSGNDTYVFQTEDSIDTILDKDNQGSITFDGATLNGGAQYGDNRVYRSADKKHLYALVDNKTLIIDGQIVVQNYSKSSETFAIKLDVATTVSPPVTNKEILGDLKPIDFDLEKSGVQTQYDELGNVKTAGPEVDRADRLFDSAGNDHIVSGGGDDYVGATEGGNDYIEAGAGRDSVKGGNGNDVIAGGDGADILVGDAGDDQIFASEVISIEVAIAAGHNLNGGAQKGDWLSGGSGDDVLVGGENNDAFSGGDGNDLIIGGAGDDDILGDSDIVPTDFNWTVFDSNGNRIFTPVLGELYLASGGADVIYAGSGNDYVWAGMGNDIIFGDEGNDRLSGVEGNDVILGGAGDDKIFGGSGADYLDAGGDADQLTGGEGDDILIGGTGDDVANGGSGRDTYIYNKGDGKDSIIDTKSETNILRFGANISSSDVILRLGSLMLDLGNGDEVHIEGFDRDDALNSSVVQSFEFADGTQLNVADLLARGFDLDGDEGDNEILGTNIVDRIHGFGGDDLLVAGAGDDNLFGDDGIDELQGGIGDDHLNGGAGNDILFGEEGDDTLDGGEGNDYLDGGAGNDIYRNVNADDFLIDLEGKNTIQFKGNISVDDIEIVEDDSYGDSPSLLLSIDGNNVALVNRSQEEDGNSYQFSNGISLTHHELLGQRFFDSANLTGTESNDILYGYAGDDSLESGSGNDRLFGFDGNDVLVGEIGNDVLIGGRGDDYLVGNSGDDIYLFDWDSGYDTIVDGGLFSENNVIRFAVGIQKENVRFEHQANGDLTIILVGMDDQQNPYVDSKITVQNWYNNPNNQISKIEFYDGTVVLPAELNTLEVLPIDGSEEDDYLVGTEYADKLRSFAGDDILDGGAGNDFLEGGQGKDTYILKYGMGQDTVIDSSQEGNAILLTTGLGFTDIAANRTGNDLYVRIAGLEQGVVVKDYYSNPQSWTVVNEAGDTQDVQEIVYATQLIEQNKVDAMWHDYAANLKASATNNYLSQGYNIDGNGIFHKSWTQSYWVSNMYAELSSTTTTTVQTISYLPAYHNGNVVTSTFVQPSINNWWSYFSNAGLQEDTAVLRNIQTYSDDATIYVDSANSYSQSSQRVVAQILWNPPTWTTSYQSPNTVTSYGWIYGGAYGSDIIGSVRNDSSYLMQSGYVRGQISALHQVGSVPISGGAYPQYATTNLDSTVTESATIEIHAGASDNSVYANLNSLVDAGDGNDFVSGAGFAFGGAGDDYLYNGTVLVGGDGDDHLEHGSLLFGGQGNDVMDGGNGATRYLIDPNQLGIDIIGDSGTSESEYRSAFYVSLGFDTQSYDFQYRLEYGGKWDLGPESSVFETYEDAVNYLEDRGSNRTIHYISPLPELPRIAANDYSALQALYDADVIDLDSIEFDEGLDSSDLVVRWAHSSQINLSWGEGKGIYIKMPTKDDPIGTGIEFVQFHDGTTWNMADLEQRSVVATATLGDDVIYGSPRDEVINALAGQDQLFGGGGNDILIGGLGDDTYVFHAGDGHDTVIEQNAQGSDRLEINGFNWYEAGVQRKGEDIVLNFNEHDQVKIANYFNHGLEIIAFADGTIWDYTELGSHAFYEGSAENDLLIGVNDFSNNIYGLEGDDQIYGGDINDVLSGNLGNDVLFGGSGNDEYAFFLGDGQDTLVEFAGEGDDVLILGDGIYAENTEVSRDGLDLLLNFNNDDKVRLQNYFNGAWERIAFSDGTEWDQAFVSTYFVMSGTDADDILAGMNGNDEIHGLAGNDLISGGLGNDLLFGDEGNDVLQGDGGDDVLDGGIGNDTMTGGSGNDIYVVDTVKDKVIENANEGADLVQSFVSYTLSPNLENLTLEGTGTIKGTGNASDNTIIGNAAANTLDGGAGIDTLIGGAGNDIYIVDNLADTVYEQAGEGIDTVHSSVSWTLGSEVERLTLTGTVAVEGNGNELNNVLIGNVAANVLNGGAGNDSLNGGAGADTLIGGSGNDIYIVDDISDMVIEQASGGIDTVQSSVNWTLGGEIERLTLTGTFAVTGGGNELDNILSGNAASNILQGGAGNDSLSGGAGADLLIGGTGNDTYTVDDVGDIVIEQADEGNDLIKSSVSYILAAHIEKLTLTGTANLIGTGNDLDNTLLGNSGANILIGDAGNDILNGGGGVDTLIGGLGNDIYVVEDISDLVIEQSDEGVDLVQSSVSYTLSENVDNLTLAGVAAINGNGNEAANILIGNSAANILFGDAGNDTLNGGAGADVMIGGTGNDLYLVDNVDDVISENTEEGIDAVQSNVSYILSAHVENLTLTGNAASNATGNELDNILTGNAGVNTLYGDAGNDVLNGGGGADTMIGGIGDDYYWVENAGDVVTEYENEGIDTIQTALNNVVLSANVENLLLLGTANLKGIGNELANTLTGNSGNNTLDGKTGADTLIGGNGNDTYVVDDVLDSVVENLNDGIDLIQSSVTYALGENLENLVLVGGEALAGYGNSLNNTLTGNTGANILDGGFGNDTMKGGLGDDTYVVDSLDDVIVEGSNSGSDSVESSVSYALSANVENLLLTGTAAINATGNTLRNLLVGNGENNTLNGAAGNDILQGGGGMDTLIDTSGNGLLDGGTGNDILIGGTGRELLVGGIGDDTITTSGGADIIAFNLGDGQDTVVASNGKDNTVSLGKGIQYADLLFKKSNTDLIFVTGSREQLTFKDWYVNTNNRSVKNLQMVIEGTADYNAALADALNNKKIQQFNFDSLVTAFDQARVADPALTSWALSSSLLGFHLGGSDTAAIGGDLTYQYAKNGDMSNISATPAQSILGNAQFGNAAQDFLPVGSSRDSSTRLM